MLLFYLFIYYFLNALKYFMLLQSSHIQQKSEELAINNQELKEKRKKNAAKRKSKEMEGNEAQEARETKNWLMWPLSSPDTVNVDKCTDH